MCRYLATNLFLLLLLVTEKKLLKLTKEQKKKLVIPHDDYCNPVITYENNQIIKPRT